MHLAKRGKKLLAAFCACALALTAAVPYTDSPISLKTVASAAAADSESSGTTYDFRDGSIVPADTKYNGGSTLTSGNLTIKPGSENGFGYNGSQHGAIFKKGNTIEIKVDGPTKLTVGGCQYNNLEQLTVKSADGSYTDTQVIKTANCYDKDGSAGVFTYTGEATTLILEFTNTAYVPVIIAEPIELTHTYDFRDGSIVPADTKYNGGSTLTSGNLTIKPGSENGFGYNGSQHGAIFKKGNTIEIKVDGPTKLTVGGCQYNNLEELTVKSADGSYTETKAIKTANCYDKDGSAGVFTYTGEATTLVLEFTNTAYVPVIITESIVAEAPHTYDFRDGSIVPADTKYNGGSNLTSGNLTIKPGSENGFGYNGSQHGAIFKKGNTIEIKVSGPTKLTVGGCQYNNLEELTVKSADGSYTETKAIKTANCYDKDGSAGVFTYTGEATTLILEFTNTAYVPVIITEPVTVEVPDKNGVEKDTVYMYNFADNSVVAQSYDAEHPVEKSLTSKDGFLTINANKDFYWHDNQHGVAMFNGNSFEIKVAGDSVVQFNLCEYGADASATIVATAPKGEFVGETSQPLMVKETDGLSTVAFEYKGVATTLKFTVKAGEGEMYLHGINVSNKPETTEPPVAAGNGKIDVWDFGAEQLDATKYNNKLTVDIINGFYSSDVKAGSDGITIGSFGTDEIFFNAGGKTNNRIRTTNTAITRYDDKTKTIDGVVYSGFAYSNSSSPVVYMGIKLYENDILTVYGASNGNPSTVYCESPSGQIQVGETTGSGTEMTFYASEYGIYKLYSVNEKLVVCRMVREHTAPVKVSGSVDVTAAAGIENKDYKLCFTNQSTGEATEAEIVGGKYSVYLNEMYTYDITLIDANGYIIKDNKPLEIAKGKGNVTKDIAIESVNLVTIKGKLTGLSADALKALKLSFVNKKYPYVPEFTISGTDITVQLEKGVTYDIVAEGINDYELSGIKTISKTEDGTQDIAFALKPVYAVTVTLDGIPDSAKASAVLTFTNLNEAGYSYTFKAGEKVQLRDGSYSVKVSNTGSAPYVQKLTSNLNVKGAAVSKTVSFEEIETWDFSKYNSKNPGIETIGDQPYYLGLVLTGNVIENKIYLLANTDGEIKIPVKKGQLVTLEYCYSAAFEVEGEKVSSNSGSTSKMESIQVKASADGFMTVKGTGQTYFTKITAATPAPYKAEVTVGEDKDYQTINDALAAVAKMDRPNNERVKIVIDPGNYEEMLVVSIPNVSLVNAAGKKASLEIINKGVDIGENVVRITGYYGHGYDYFSMGSDVKWNAEVLAANKENGYISTKNPGSGTTNGSYWNSTVVIYGDGFEADGIVFENSFNQYISKKESEDTVVMWASGGKGIRPTTYGDTSVQTRSFVERAGALAIVGDHSVFNNCKFIGRQDTLYGGTNIKAVFQKCDILGAVDYIYGGMTAVFYQCNLVMNTDDKTASDQAYLTAAQQQSAGRGYLMYNCTVTSTTPGVDTASETRSKPGYFGRPWQANTSEVVFYNTIIETTDYPDADGNPGQSLIVPQGWNNTLGGTSPYMYEYGTVEKSGADNSASRADWTTVLETPYIDDGKTKITIKAFLGDEWTDELNERGLVLEIVEFKDEATGIEAIVTENTFEKPEDIKFSVKPVADETTDTKYTFDISFIGADGNKVPPNGDVIVKIPVPEKLKDKTIYVYHEEEDGTYTSIDFTIEDDMVVFTASKFSKYIVTSEKLDASDDDNSNSSDDSNSGTNEPGNNPSTGAATGIAISFAALAAVTSATLVISKKKRK